MSKYDCNDLIAKGLVIEWTTEEDCSDCYDVKEGFHVVYVDDDGCLNNVSGIDVKAGDAVVYLESYPEPVSVDLDASTKAFKVYRLEEI